MMEKIPKVMPKGMRALLYEGKNTLRFRTVPLPKIGTEDVLLCIRSVGICGTDLHIYHGGMDIPPGTILGHEFSGEIAKVGSRVKRLNVGDRVVAEHVIACGACHYCKRGKPNLCLQAKVLGLHLPGALAQYMRVPASLVHGIPPTVSFDEASLIEPLAIAVYTASVAGYLLEKKVAVVGQGPIGVLLDHVLTAGGAQVVGIDVLDDRLRFVRQQGWTHLVLNPQRSDFRKRMAAFAPIGVQDAFEVVGKAATADLCVDLTRKNGSVYLLGIFESKASIDLMKVVKKELHVNGSWTCAFAFPRAIELVREKKVNLKELITHTYTFKNAARAFAEADAYAGKRMKTIIRMG